MFDRDDFNILKDVVDGFSLMTYDYATHNGMMAPNAPIDWVEQNALYFIQDEPEDIRAKLLIGLNFYGMKYELVNKDGSDNFRIKSQPEAVTGAQLIDWLKASKQKAGGEVKIIFDQAAHEHYYVAMQSEIERTVVFYPSLYSIQKRIELAEKLVTGLSIWELGQGLDYFYDLF